MTMSCVQMSAVLERLSTSPNAGRCGVCHGLRRTSALGTECRRCGQQGAKDLPTGLFQGESPPAVAPASPRSPTRLPMACLA